MQLEGDAVDEGPVIIALERILGQEFPVAAIAQFLHAGVELDLAGGRHVHEEIDIFLHPAQMLVERRAG